MVYVFLISSGKDDTLVAGRNDLSLFRMFLSGTRMAAMRERIRIRAAPRLFTSSIFQAGVDLAGISQDIS